MLISWPSFPEAELIKVRLLISRSCREPEEDADASTHTQVAVPCETIRSISATARNQEPVSGFQISGSKFQSSH